MPGSETAAIEKLMAIVRAEEKRVSNSFTLDKRLALLELTRAIDSYYFLRTTLRNNKQHRRESELDDLYTFGWNKALSLFLDDAVKHFGVPLVPSIRESMDWADSVLQHCGRLSMCEFLTDLCRAGLATVLHSEKDRYVFTYVADPIGMEAIEREEFHWLRNFIVDLQQGVYEELSLNHQAVRQLMRKLVKPWREHFISYTTTPEIDAHYEALGILHAQQMFGQDSFPGEAEFGGQEFNLYRATVGVLAGWTLKHIGFCLALLEDNPGIELRNIICTFQPIEKLAWYLAEALDVEMGVALQGLQSVLLDTDNKRYHCGIPVGPSPPLIMIGDGQVLRSVAGCLSTPFYFMLRELKRRYPSDWDRAVNMREDVFRKELYQLFPGRRFVKATGNVKIKMDNKVATDIDAVVLDTKTGVLGLFQLKWQDAFGYSMRERESRKRNLYRSIGKWIDVVQDWISGGGALELARTLVPADCEGRGVKDIKMFVLGRNFAHFSGADIPDERAAWGMWPQVLRLASQEYKMMNPLGWLYESLKKDSPLTKEIPQLDDHDFRIGKTRIEVRTRVS